MLLLGKDKSTVQAVLKKIFEKSSRLKIIYDDHFSQSDSEDRIHSKVHCSIPKSSSAAMRVLHNAYKKTLREKILISQTCFELMNELLSELLLHKTKVNKSVKK